MRDLGFDVFYVPVDHEPANANVVKIVAVGEAAKIWSRSVRRTLIEAGRWAIPPRTSSLSEGREWRGSPPTVEYLRRQPTGGWGSELAALHRPEHKILDEVKDTDLLRTGLAGPTDEVVASADTPTELLCTPVDTGWFSRRFSRKCVTRL